MPQELQTSIGEVFVGLGQLAQQVATNQDAGVDAAITPQRTFFRLVQQRAANIGDDIVAAKNRQEVNRKKTWADELMVQAVTDLREAQATMGLTQGQQDRITQTIAAVEAARAEIQAMWAELTAQGVR